MPAATARRLSPEEMLAGEVDPQEVLRRCGRTFHAASRILPANTRRELALLYAFCRLVDDCGDLVEQSGDGGASSIDLLDRVERCLLAEEQSSPLIASFRELAERRGAPLVFAQQLIDGVRSDLGPVRMATQHDLLRYAYRVASTVGLMMCRVLGVAREGDPFAIDLGIAMQLTNIARDVAEDALADRVYIPSSWIDHEVVMRVCRDGDGREAEMVVDAVERLLLLADRYYDSANEGMRFLPAPVRPGIRAAAINYRAIGAVIRRDPHRAVRERVRTSGLSKACRTTVAIAASIADNAPMRRQAVHDARLHIAVAPLWRTVAPS